MSLAATNEVVSLRSLLGGSQYLHTKEDNFLIEVVESGPNKADQWGGVQVLRAGTYFLVKELHDYSLSYRANVINVRGAGTDGGTEAVNVHGNTKVRRVDNEKLASDLLLELELLVNGQTLMDRSHHYKVGADPEIFAVTGTGELLPAFKFLGSKADANGVLGVPYWDGYQAEFTVVPNECMAYMFDTLRGAMKDTLRAAKKVDDKAKLSLTNVMEIPLETLAAEETQYTTFGCTPSLNAYDEPQPKGEPLQIPFRSAGGHLHLTQYNCTPEKIKEYVKRLDKILGVISVAMFQYYDQPRRRVLYGRAGEYRLPSHGLEYRVLSNAWLCHPAAANFVFECARRADVGDVLSFLNWDITQEEAIMCINHCDVEMAKALLTRNRQGLRTLLASMNTQGTAGIALWEKIIFEGIHKFLKTPDNPSHVWKLEKGNWITHSDGACGNMSTSTSHLLEEGTLD